MRWLLVLPILMILTVAYARAEPTPICTVYTGKERVTPTDARDILELFPDAVVKICSPPRGPMEIFPDLHFVDYRVPRKELPVCHYIERPIFMSPSGWTLSPPPEEDYRARPVDLMLETATGECPPPEDTFYVRATGVSPQRFLEVIRYWRRITSTEAQFAAEVRNLPMDADRRPEIEKFQTVLRESIDAQKFVTIEGIGRAHDSDDLYEAHIRAKRGTWLARFEFSGAEFRLRDLTPTIE